MDGNVTLHYHPFKLLRDCSIFDSVSVSGSDRLMDPIAG